MRDISRNKDLRAAGIILVAVFSMSIGINIFFMRIPFLSAIVQTLIPLVVIGSIIGIVLRIGRFEKVKKG